jgi:hypothetical protein
MPLRAAIQAFQRPPIQQRVTVRRETILPKKALKQPGIPATSWILLIVTLGAGLAVFIFTHGKVIPPFWRWLITGTWIALTLGLGLYDFVAMAGKPGETDASPLDRWTFSHAGAGVVFGVWYLPFVWLVAFTVVWEIFEIKVKGFGESEIVKNRVVDIAIAWIGWLAIIALMMGPAVGDAPFPWYKAPR